MNSARSVSVSQFQWGEETLCPPRRRSGSTPGSGPDRTIRRDARSRRQESSYRVPATPARDRARATYSTRRTNSSSTCRVATMTVISGARRWGLSWHSRGTAIVAVLVAPACSATLGDRMGGAGAVSDLWGRPRRSRSPRRCAPLSAAPASRPSGPSCANACASTTPVSVSLSKLSNSAASPSAAPTAGTCHPDAHRRLPTSSHPATVLHQRRFRNGTTTARTPRHLSCNEPRLRARSATPSSSSSTDC